MIGSRCTTETQAMTDAMKPDAETTEFVIEHEIRTFSFEVWQSKSLHQFSEELAAVGGPQSSGAKSKASLAAAALKHSCSLRPLSNRPTTHFAKVSAKRLTLNTH